MVATKLVHLRVSFGSEITGILGRDGGALEVTLDRQDASARCFTKVADGRVSFRPRKDLFVQLDQATAPLQIVTK